MDPHLPRLPAKSSTIVPVACPPPSPLLLFLLLILPLTGCFTRAYIKEADARDAEAKAHATRVVGPVLSRRVVALDTLQATVTSASDHDLSLKVGIGKGVEVTRASQRVYRKQFRALALPFMLFLDVWWLVPNILTGDFLAKVMAKRIVSPPGSGWPVTENAGTVVRIERDSQGDDLPLGNTQVFLQRRDADWPKLAAVTDQRGVASFALGSWQGLLRPRENLLLALSAEGRSQSAEISLNSDRLLAPEVVSAWSLLQSKDKGTTTEAQTNALRLLYERGLLSEQEMIGRQRELSDR